MTCNTETTQQSQISGRTKHFAFPLTGFCGRCSVRRYLRLPTQYNRNHGFQASLPVLMDYAASHNFRIAGSSESIVSRSSVNYDVSSVFADHPLRILGLLRRRTQVYNFAHGWPSPLARSSDLMRFNHRWVLAAWVRCTEPGTRVLIAPLR